MVSFWKPLRIIWDCFAAMNCLGKIFRRRQSASSLMTESSSALVQEAQQPNESQAMRTGEAQVSELKATDATPELDHRPSSDNVLHSLHPNQKSQPRFVRSEASEKLRQRLQDARSEYPAASHHFFIAECDKADIITTDVVASEIHGANPNLSLECTRERAIEVCNSSRNLFAILAYLRKGGEVCAFLNEGLTDEDLPFERSQHKDRKSQFSLQKKNGEKIEALEGWKGPELEALGRKQWFMLAPVFEYHEHCKLHENTVLPFLTPDTEEQAQPNQSGGGYSDVFTTRIHTAHHNFHHHWSAGDHDQKVAVKRLHKNDAAEFEKERSILTILGKKKNASPHLVKLLATYELQGKYHLMFPRANCNLRTYWTNQPRPVFDERTVLWSLKQMLGIATALNTIHNFRVTIPLDVGGKVRSPQKGVKLSVKEGEELYGRHGDIKPENILWFEQIPEYEDYGQGVLQIADFGLGRFHGRDSKTEPWPHNVRGSPTYEPPECKLHRPVSRAYDLWSLGCLYLEFATWLLRGFEDIEGFSENRGRQSSVDPNFSDDYFFTVIRGDGGEPKDAEIREGVMDWVKSLHNHPQCSKFIHDLLDLVMKELLLIDATKRIHTAWLCVQFKNLLKKAEKEEEYLCKADPRLPEHPGEHHGRTMSASAILTQSHEKSSRPPKSPTSPKSPRSPKKVSFVEWDETKDLLLRDVGTPALMVSKSKSQTWPSPRPQL